MDKLLNILSRINVDKDQINIPKTNPNSGSFTTALATVFGVLGAVALLVIVLAGLTFVLSRGNPEQTAKARNAIIYAAIGLIICMSAFAIVRFVVRNV